MITGPAAKEKVAFYKVTAVDITANESAYSNTVNITVNEFIPRKIAWGNNDDSSIPLAYNLYGNYPNPFNPQTTIRFGLPEDSKVKINVYDLNGRMFNALTNKQYNAGYHQLQFDASHLASGIYLYTMEVESLEKREHYSQTRKMVLLR